MSTTASFSAEPMKQLNLDSSQVERRVTSGNENQSHAQKFAVDKTPAWKQEVNLRLAAHRSRRRGARNESIADTPEGLLNAPVSARDRAAEAAARVAERYAKAPSYNQWLAEASTATTANDAQVAEAHPAISENDGSASAVSKSDLDTGAEQRAGSETRPATRPAGTNDLPWLWQESASESTASSDTRSIFDDWSDMQLRPFDEPAVPSLASNPAVGTGFSEDALSRHLDSQVEARFDHDFEDRHGDKIDDVVGGLGEVYDASAADPLESAIVEPVQSIPANLIEFPREIIAPRKARPRLAEGPFWDPSQENSQLSIFEVDPKLISSPLLLGDGSVQVAPPEWASIELDHPEEPADVVSREGSDSSLDSDSKAAATQVLGSEIYPRPAIKDPGYPSAQLIRRYEVESRPDAVHREEGRLVGSGSTMSAPSSLSTWVSRGEKLFGKLAQADEESHPKISSENESVGTAAESVAAPNPAADDELPVASLSDRLLATVVDAALVTLAFLTAAIVVIAATPHPPTGRVALVASVCGLLLFGILYQVLFLSLAEGGTPGMRYAKIALCNFEDSNPTLDQMVKRIPALLLSVLPLGLGFAWALFDGDHLAWHDRMTQTYLRKY